MSYKQYVDVLKILYCSVTFHKTLHELNNENGGHKIITVFTEFSLRIYKPHLSSVSQNDYE